ncbi:tRNA pseudouridine synthase D TruD [Anaeromyxobacter dehalogenans 2CP-1]|uniref:tRNA pseudouridine synthase D n=1 Tax=Anaeromyxobacter dehalogenans (strain ATCC BAA-258 / DSM 21875 / 2CP-1) TaxID=455488 RepID=TRUD_ANAD2|nr:tRNA pseudouridine(13) synthase TruD [Anaeromyxobacter dehalogenans]B8J7C8.1 RecName: Full=tRNA pseudouridine synthase D; AltName: Full=tRNA pseudouridine(13) synthase; AltName: Full=tRNA pseudouridylate synthase D; AltName: Full=tRNA-uridine isomerase D [Anaeromyxobacter dehalogenans 2CP-1]ACL67108.1 tRNA pseudouridine synthase D TruD [Anaeromyxobacter dehalogenans 2CP-1]
MTDLPFVTADLPGSGGALRRAPEDFRVDEVPAYLPSGAGPHLYLRVEKRGRTSRDAVRELARALGVPERDAGCAGLKDKDAVTTQWLSFPVARDPDPAALAAPGLRVLEASRHQNKLRTGHVRANRFTLAVRGGDLGRARECAGALAARGLPNFFGPQRFGAAGRNAAVGRALVTGERTPEAGRAARDRFLRRLSLSAYQSLLFNRWLAERMADGLFAAALAGDAMKKLDTGGLFTCEDPAADGPRVERFEISPAGPMFGHALRLAAGEAGAREARLLEAEGIALADFARGGGEAEGTRRAARLRVEVALEPLEDGYRAAFELPRGAYATVVMRELTKGEAELPEDAD